MKAIDMILKRCPWRVYTMDMTASCLAGDVCTPETCAILYLLKNTVRQRNEAKIPKKDSPNKEGTGTR